MTAKQRRNTLYSQWVRGVVCLYFGQGKGAFTIKQLAEFANCPITHNFRKRIGDMVLSGELNLEIVLIGERGSAHLYTRGLPF